MASVSSASPSGHSFRHEDPESDWEHLESNPSSSSVQYFHSPASGSLNSWGVVQQQLPSHPRPSPPAVSPLDLTDDQSPPFTMPDQADPAMAAGGMGIDGNFMSTGFDNANYFSSDFLFADQFTSGMPLDSTSYLSSSVPSSSDLNLNFGDFDLDSPVSQQQQQQQQQQNQFDFGQFRADSNVPPWNPTNAQSLAQNQSNSNLQSPIDIRQPQHIQYQKQQQQIQQMQMQRRQQQQHSHSRSPSHASPGSSSHFSSPGSPEIKVESEKAPSPIRRTKGSKVEKRKAPTSNFVIVTPNLINAQSGKPNPFECFEAMRATQRGRKGPLANDTKESALQVRRRGACFCCHSRKVKCDSERPCKNCKKMTTAVPQIMCWQFQDFLPVLFPEFIRGHLRKEQVSSFITDNVQEFRIDGADRPCSVEFSSGSRFQSTLTVPATFFTARTPEVLQHWHLTAQGGQSQLQALAAVPIGIDPDNAAHREEMKKRSREYIHNLTFEPFYAEQVTDAIRGTQLPQRVLKIVQRYAQRTNAPMVKRALSIYVLHYVLTRQLCLTETAIFNLQHTNLVPLNSPVLTSRVLNRQVKAVLDELLLKDMQTLFDGFSKSLKPKSKKEWGPCLAAFLVLCLFMESVETAAGHFVRSENELSRRNRRQHPGWGTAVAAPVPFSRDFAPGLCREIDNMPFKQFAYQFHQVYQTHTKDATTKAFNPLVDDNEGFAQQQQGELDPAAAGLVADLKPLLQGDGWFELDFLVPDPIFPPPGSDDDGSEIGNSAPPPPDHTGRLLARFLLSFTDEKYLFDGQY